MRVNVKSGTDYPTADALYTGFAIFGRKKCGQDFLDKLNSREVNFDLFDTEAQYLPQYDYMRADGGTSSITLQWSRNAIVQDGLGNAKKDQFYLELSGLDKVDWSGKDMLECITGAQIGSGPASLSTADHTYCIGWQKTIRN